MQKMRNDPKYIDDPEWERIIAIGSKADMERKFMDFESLALFGGYIGYDTKLTEKYENKTFVIDDLEIILWQMGDNVYLSPLGRMDVFNTRNRIHGNLDIKRMNNDPEYRKFIIENVITEEFISTGGNKFEINEKDGELSVTEISEKEERPQSGRNNRNTYNVDR